MVKQKRLAICFVAVSLMFFGFNSISWALQQVPDVLKPNPQGLARPSHLGSEWPDLNPDEKLYSLQFDLLRAHYQKWSQQHTIEQAPKDPNLEEMFEICNYKVLPPDYYGEVVVEDYYQPFTELSASLSGSTGLIDIPSAYTQKKGVMLASLVLTNVSGGNQYMPELYQNFDAFDISTMFTYGFRDNIELTFTMRNLSRDIEYSSGKSIDDSKFLMGMGVKGGFGTWADKYQIAMGANVSMYGDGDRDLILDTDYESFTDLYATMSTDSKMWNAHIMWKYISYHHSSKDILPHTGHIPGGGANSGLAPPAAHWGQLGIGFEYKIPDTRYRLISELTKSEISWGSESNKSINLAVHREMEKLDLKLYGRKLNQDGRNEIGLISTYHF